MAINAAATAPPMRSFFRDMRTPGLIIMVLPMDVNQSDTSKKASEQEPMLFCPVCSLRLSERKCKLYCEQCGYFMSCADYY
jgi:hypothetical protein